MTHEPMAIVLLCLAAALSWGRFQSLFSASTGHASLYSPMTAIATTVFLTAAGFLVWPGSFALAAVALMLSIALGVLLQRMLPALSVASAAICLLVFFDMTPAFTG